MLLQRQATGGIAGVSRRHTVRCVALARPLGGKSSPCPRPSSSSRAPSSPIRLDGDDARKEKEPVAAVGGGSGGGIDKSGGGGGGGGGDGSSGSGSGGSIDPQVAALLVAAGRKIESFPSDFAAGILSGKVTAEILQRYFEVEKMLFSRLVWGIQGFRERLLGDPSFPVKLAIELGIGLVMKLTAEKTKRGKNFVKEADFVFANVVMALIADFMLTWLPAPTLSLAPKAVSSNALSSFFARCPDNAFQVVQPGMEPFTLAQRLGAIIRNGSKLLGVGFCASMIGVGVTNGLLSVRTMLDPTLKAPNQPQDVVKTSAAYGVYMSISSNLRYQIVAGILEERGIEVLFRGNHNLCHALSFGVRTLNTFVGSCLWVDFVRLCGMQKASAEKKTE